LHIIATGSQAGVARRTSTSTEGAGPDQVSVVSPGQVKVVTIGIYEFSVASFVAALRASDVQRVLDLRQRRGVRGARYAWANSLRVQATLRDAQIAYAHLRELAPTTELRHLQYREDDRLGVGKRSRVQLADAYRRRYRHEILAAADLDVVAESLSADYATALLCLEREPAACHRSLVAERLEADYGAAVAHIVPLTG
jgi:uncharacterized protein (DUF488 family)